MYVSQFLLAFGGTYFLGPTMVAGMGAVIAEPRNLVSFSVMFTMTQNLGGLLGAAIVGTIQTAREKYHSSYLVENLTMLDPNVAARVQSGANAYGSVLTDPVLRSAAGVARLGAAATREANVLAYNDVFLMIAGVAIATMIWMWSASPGPASQRRASPVGPCAMRRRHGHRPHYQFGTEQ